MNFLVIDIRINGANKRLDHVAAIIGLTDNQVRFVLVIKRHCFTRPLVRCDSHSLSLKTITVLVPTMSSDTKTRLIAILMRGWSWIDRHDNTIQNGRLCYAIFIQLITLP